VRPRTPTLTSSPDDRQLENGRSAPVVVDDVSTAGRRIRPLRIVAVALMVLLGAQLLNFLVYNKKFGWPVVKHYLFNSLVLHGVKIMLELTVISMFLGILIGVAIAAARMSTFGPFRFLAWGYTRFFFGIPLLVQLLFWFNLAYLVPHISLGIPFGPSWGDWNANKLIAPFTAAVLGLALHEGAYMSEVVRAGLLSVERGQRDAARSLGLHGFKAFRLITLPQAMRFIVPPTVNQCIGVLKATALVSTVGVTDLLTEVKNIYNRTFDVIPMLVVACIWYFVAISVLDIGQRLLERRFARSSGRTPVPRRAWLSRRLASTGPGEI
jgi:polar amino acid transport system permease protein